MRSVPAQSVFLIQGSTCPSLRYVFLFKYAFGWRKCEGGRGGLLPDM